MGVLTALLEMRLLLVLTAILALSGCASAKKLMKNCKTTDSVYYICEEP